MKTAQKHCQTKGILARFDERRKVDIKYYGTQTSRKRETSNCGDTFATVALVDVATLLINNRFALTIEKKNFVLQQCFSLLTWQNNNMKNETKNTQVAAAQAQNWLFTNKNLITTPHFDDVFTQEVLKHIQSLRIADARLQILQLL